MTAKISDADWDTIFRDAGELPLAEAMVQAADILDHRHEVESGFDKQAVAVIASLRWAVDLLLAERRDVVPDTKVFYVDVGSIPPEELLGFVRGVQAVLNAKKTK